MERARRERRQVSTANEERAKESKESNNRKKWSEEEKRKLFSCLKIYGHKDLNKMKEELPGRSKEEIRRFLIVVHSTARQRQTSNSSLKYWLNRSISETEKSKVGNMNDFYSSAQIIKFLSVDKLLESHPKPKNCGGIDFSAAYRLMYQALMGYPLQPVNQATADFISDCLIELNEITNCNFKHDLTKFLINKYQNEDKNKLSKGKISESSMDTQDRKMVYVKKRYVNRKSSANQLDVPPLKIVVSEETTNPLNNMKCYSLAIGNSKEVSTVVVPVVNNAQQHELEEAASNLWKNIEFNPLGLPNNWCSIPLNCEYSSEICVGPSRKLHKSLQQKLLV